jgi:RNA polymerase sigma-70 factor, ECF subfamily
VGLSSEHSARVSVVAAEKAELQFIGTPFTTPNAARCHTNENGSPFMNNSNDLTDPATEGDDYRSFERDVLPLAGDLHRRARSYTKNAADAEDLVQDTLLKAFRAFDQLRGETHLRAWLLCIMRNTWISNHRASQRRPAEILSGDIADGHLDAVVTPTAAHAVSAEHQALRHELDPELVVALQALSADVRKTVYYVAIRGMGCREAAEILGIPEGTVLSRMHRTRIKLRQSLSMDSRGHAA